MNGYVLKFKLSMVVFVFLIKIFFLFLCVLLTYSIVFAMNGSMRDAIFLYRIIFVLILYLKLLNWVVVFVVSVCKVFVNLLVFWIFFKWISLRVVLEAYAGSMSRFVVSILFLFNFVLCKLLIFLWRLNNKCVWLDIIICFWVFILVFNKVLILLNIFGRCITTSLSTTYVVFLFKILFGMRCSVYFFLLLL